MSDSRKLTLAAVAAAAFAFLLYLPALQNGFVNWDDPDYVTAHPLLGQVGWFDYLTWAATSWFSNNWHPLTWISLGIDYAIFGRENASGYHATSALLHAANSFLVVRLAAALFARASGASSLHWLAAAGVGVVFAVHPVHVESVAWVSERKDVLYAFFFLASLLAYLRFVDAQAPARRRWYAAALALFALSIASKPMAVSLPLVLLILDAYPLKRLGGSQRFRVVVVEKAPFVALSLLGSWLTVTAQTAGGALSAGVLPLFDRLLLAERAVGFYLLKFCWPAPLAPLYPLPDSFSLGSVEFIAPLLTGATITIVALVRAKRTPALLAAWAAFGVMLAPVLGVVQVGNQAAADRYMYLPMLAPLLLLGGLALRVAEARRPVRFAVAAAVAAGVGVLCTLSLAQIAIWQSSVTLWEHEVAIYPRSTTALHNLGFALQEAGELGAAEERWRATLAVDPDHMWAATDLGNLMKTRGDLVEAERLYRIAIGTGPPRFAVAHLNLANLLAETGRGAEASQHFRIFVQIAPPQYAAIAAQIRARLAGY